MLGVDISALTPSLHESSAVGASTGTLRGMYVTTLTRRYPLGEESVVPTVKPLPWVLGASALVAMVYFSRRKRKAR